MARALVSLVALALASASARAQVLSRTSLKSDGSQVNGASSRAALSHDARFVAFDSSATNAVAGDTNGVSDVFVRDRTMSITERVSVSSSGAQALGASSQPDITADGSIVAFESLAENLVGGDSGGHADVFVHDRANGTTTRVSVDSGGEPGNGSSTAASLSADGRFVAFISHATNLVAGDTNLVQDVFVHDRTNSVTQRASVSSSGAQANEWCYWPALSGDGRYVAFESFATNLVAGDTNGAHDVFLRDLQTSQTLRIVSDSSGAGGVDLSHDGNFVAFASNASDLVVGDTNETYDVFVHDRASSTTTRVSVASSGAQAQGGFRPSISGDGRWVAFDSYATDMTPGGAALAQDVFAHDTSTGKTWLVSVSVSGSFGGTGDSSFAALSADGLHVAFESDASWLVPGDTNLAKDVFLRDLPDPQFQSYCTAGVSSSGCRAVISATGAPSVSAASGFTLAVFDIEGGKSGIVFYGVGGQTAAPWGTGTSFLCVKSPTQRMGLINGPGTAGACDGAFWVDWNAYVASHPTALGAPFSAGQSVDAQAWYRDPPAPKTTNLSDGVRFVVGG